MSAPVYAVPKGDPATLRTAAKRFKDLAHGHTSELTSFKRHVEAALKDWTGPLATQYRAVADDVCPRFKAVQDATGAAHGALLTYATALESAQSTIGGANKAHDQQNQNHHDPDRNQALRRIGQSVDRARTSLSQAAGACAKALDHAETTLQQTCPDTMSAQQLRDAVKRAGDELKEENPGLWEKIFGPEGALRNWDEKLHAVPAPYADMVLFKLLSSAEGAEKSAESAAEFAAKIPELMEADFPKMARPIMNAMSRGEATVDDLAKAIDEFAKDWDAIGKWNAGAQAADASEAARLPALRGLGLSLNGLAFIGDVYTVWKPEDDGAVGWSERAAAGVNGGLVVWDSLAALQLVDAVPVVGEVVMVGTGLYLGGTYLYHHWKPFRNVCNDVGHTVASAAKSTWHAVTSIF